MRRLVPTGPDQYAGSRAADAGEEACPGGRSLTPRQLEISLLVAAGCSNAEVARQLGISEQTVKNHLKVVFDRTGVRSRVQLALYMYQRAEMSKTA